MGLGPTRSTTQWVAVSMLLAASELTRDDAQDYYGVMMSVYATKIWQRADVQDCHREEAYIQANIVFTYSSYYVAECML